MCQSFFENVLTHFFALLLSIHILLQLRVGDHVIENFDISLKLISYKLISVNILHLAYMYAVKVIWFEAATYILEIPF